MRVAFFVLSAAAAYAQTDFDITTCDNGNINGWTNDDAADFVNKMVWGAIVGILMALLFIVLASLPLCCGVMKGPAKIIAGLAVGFGLLACLMPYFSSLATSCSDFIDAICSNCTYEGPSCAQDPCAGCDPDLDTALIDNCGLVSSFASYIFWGWAAVVLGITSLALGCCIFCNCCKMKDDGNHYVAQQNNGAYQPPTSYA